MNLVPCVRGKGLCVECMQMKFEGLHRVRVGDFDDREQGGLGFVMRLR